MLNRYDPAFDFERWQIEGVLSAATAAVVPFDHAGARRAARDGRPLVCDGRSRAGRALLDLAERAHGSRLRLAPAARDAPPPATGPVSRARLALATPLVATLRRLGGAVAWPARLPGWTRLPWQHGGAGDPPGGSGAARRRDAGATGAGQPSGRMASSPPETRPQPGGAP